MPQVRKFSKGFIRRVIETTKFFQTPTFLPLNLLLAAIVTRKQIKDNLGFDMVVGEIT